MQRVSHEFCYALNKQYTKETNCTPSIECNVFPTCSHVQCNDHVVHQGTTLQIIWPLGAMGYHNFCNTMTRQYTMETLCKPSGHLVLRVSHDFSYATTEQRTKETLCKPSGHLAQGVSHELCNAMITNTPKKQCGDHLGTQCNTFPMSFAMQRPCNTPRKHNDDHHATKYTVLPNVLCNDQAFC